MGRELQKHKNRSSIAKVTRKPKSKKRILSNKIIADNWDKSQTLVQNYRRLGLTVKLNKSTGGVEKRPGDVVAEDPLNVEVQRKMGRDVVEVGEAKIVRDPDTGAILEVLDDGRTTRPNPLGDPLNHLDSDSEGEGEKEVQAKTQTVAALEEEARRPESKYQRKQTEGEVAFIEELVRKHGDDVLAMARDMKVNYMQRSEGDLKRRITKWRDAGGVV